MEAAVSFSIIQNVTVWQGTKQESDVHVKDPLEQLSSRWIRGGEIGDRLRVHSCPIEK